MQKIDTVLCLSFHFRRKSQSIIQKCWIICQFDCLHIAVSLREKRTFYCFFLWYIFSHSPPLSRSILVNFQQCHPCQIYQISRLIDYLILCVCHKIHRHSHKNSPISRYVSYSCHVLSFLCHSSPEWEWNFNNIKKPVWRNYFPDLPQAQKHRKWPEMTSDYFFIYFFVTLHNFWLNI